MTYLTQSLSGVRRALSVAALSALCISAGVATPADAQEKIRWKVQATFNTGWPALGDPIARVSKTLDAATDGRIKLKIFEPGKIVPPLEISPSISNGSLPAAYNYLAYDQGRIPSAVLFSAVPFGMEPWEYAAWWFEGEGHGLAEDIYHAKNIHPLLCSTIGPETAGWWGKKKHGYGGLAEKKYFGWATLHTPQSCTGSVPTRSRVALVECWLVLGSPWRRCPSNSSRFWETTGPFWRGSLRTPPPL